MGTGLRVLLLLVTVVWGWTFPVVKQAVAVYGVLAFLTVRFALAAFIVSIAGVWRGTRRSWQVGGAIGLVLAIAYLLQTFGIRHTSATNSGLITGLFVVFAPLWNRLLYGVRIDRIHVGAVAASCIGLLLLTGVGVSPPGVGDLLTLGCALCFGLHICLLDRHAAAHDACALAAAQLSVATIVFAAAWPICEPISFPSMPVWPALVLTAVGATAGGFTILTMAQRYLPAVQVAVILSMEPLFAALFGRLLEGDRLTLVQLLGGAIMVAALLVANVHHARTNAIERNSTP